jgi:hypothetical protein
MNKYINIASLERLTKVLLGKYRKCFGEICNLYLGIFQSECFTDFFLQVKDHPVKAQPADAPASIILSKQPKLEVWFDLSHSHRLRVSLYFLFEDSCAFCGP